MPIPDGFARSSVQDLKLATTGQAIQGELIARNEMEFTDEKTGEVRLGLRYTIRDARGGVWGLWGNYHMNDGMAAAKIGDHVYIERLFDLPPKNPRNSPAKQYDVAIRPANAMVRDDDVPF